MDSDESLETNLNTVKNMILDEEKIVTYISLSRDLCIHINKSKQLLHLLVRKIPEQCPNIKLNVNYIISGLTDDCKARTTICTEDDLKNLKSSLKTVFYEHVYSVNKGSPGTDHVAYLLVSKFDDFNLCAGLIKNSECNKMTIDEIGCLKGNNRQTVSNGGSDSIPQKKIKTESKSLFKNNQVENKTDAIVTENMKSKIKTEVVSPTKDLNNKQNNNHKTQKGIAGFFSKSNNTVNKKLTKEPEQKLKTIVKENIQLKDEKMEMVVENQILKTKISDKEESISKKKNKVLTQTKKPTANGRKRKRVLYVSGSDSDEEADPFAVKEEIKSESDDEIPPTPSANSIKITSGIVNPKKRRKVVDKTYMDEEGYIHTVKEEIYESYSENEDDKNVKQNVKEIKVEKKEISPKDKKNDVIMTKKKISPQQKGKQATLAQFFKKK
ncbi:DNA polymerase delta subunit 3-like [Vanessa tameamea]|uniref:DNA polymerase delta subunit 3 n=1 Tax=Vanessa tameamea TaxID=334116 RepID=A0A8B8HLZ3_VANTA|nr:DNA polymerase delta subunit 3-like [Vanessa tameamea]